MLTQLLTMTTTHKFPSLDVEVEGVAGGALGGLGGQLALLKQQRQQREQGVLVDAAFVLKEKYITLFRCYFDLIIFLL